MRRIQRSPVIVNSHHKGQWRRALIVSLICAWIDAWVNNHEAGNLRCHHAHYDVIVLDVIISITGLLTLLHFSPFFIWSTPKRLSDFLFKVWFQLLILFAVNATFCIRLVICSKYLVSGVVTGGLVLYQSSLQGKTGEQSSVIPCGLLLSTSCRFMGVWCYSMTGFTPYAFQGNCGVSQMVCQILTQLHHY